MACGLPVVTTSVGGNAEVVAHPGLGILVPFGEPDELARAMSEALRRDWDRDSIVAHAEANAWDQRVAVLVDEFTEIVAREAGADVPDRAVHCA
jgi:glycosyltransferase involved in cell wall biosynthesis